MLISDILINLDENSPPFQPFISNSHILDYQELKMQWNPVCIKKDALFYQFRTGKQPTDIELLPDACLNVLFSCYENKPEVTYSGTFLSPKKLHLKADTLYFGFKPYSTLGIASPNIWLGELVDAFEDFSHFFPNVKQLAENLCPCESFSKRITTFNHYAKQYLIDWNYKPGFIDYFTVMICSSKGTMLFNNLESITGYSERYCREKFKEAYGLSPKKYSSIIRFQNVLKSLISTKHEDLATLAFSNAYFDQAHFIHDFKKFTNISPQKFRKNYYESCKNNRQFQFADNELIIG